MALTQRRNIGWGATLLVLGMCLRFAVEVPTLSLDRAQEDWYLGVPYYFVAKGKPVVNQLDPFPENSPALVYTAASLLHATGKLLSVRIFLFSFSVAALLGIYLLSFKLRRKENADLGECLFLALLCLGVWVSVPLSMSYPIQTNGMLAGVTAIVAGLWVLEKHPHWAAFLFGVAYSCKAQFLGLLPGFVLFQCVWGQGNSFKTRALYVAKQIFLFFCPTMVVFSLLHLVLGHFESGKDFREYALRGPELLVDELTAAFRSRLMHQELSGSAQQQLQESIERRHIEFGRFGFLSWAQIFFSLSAMLLLLGVGIRKKLSKTSLSPALCLLGAVGTVYWFHYLIFNKYAYWYNVFPVILFNTLFASFLVSRLWDRNKIFKVALTVIALGLLVNRLLVNPVWKGNFREGNSLTPYDWMAHPHLPA